MYFPTGKCFHLIAPRNVLLSLRYAIPYKALRGLGGPLRHNVPRSNVFLSFVPMEVSFRGYFRADSSDNSTAWSPSRQRDAREGTHEYLSSKSTRETKLRKQSQIKRPRENALARTRRFTDL